MRYLRTNTAVIITVGPFYDKTDGVTIETALTITNERITLTADTDAGSAPTVILDNVTGATSGTANDLNYISGNDAGFMQLELAAADVNRLGRMFLSITDAANHCPVFHEFMVLPAMVYDSLVLGSDVLQSDVTQWLGTAAATPTVAGVPEVDQTHYLGAAAPALVSSNYPANVSTISANAITATSIDADAITAAKVADGTIDAATFAAGAINAAAIADGAIDDAAVAADMDGYAAKIWVVKEGTTADHYAVGFFKNGQPVTSGITSPTIQVIKASDASDLIASTALTQIGSLGLYKKDESTNKMAGGAIYFAKVEATIDSSTRTWFQQIGRDAA